MNKLALVLALPFTMIYDVAILLFSALMILMWADDTKIWPLTAQVIQALVRE